MRNADFPSPFRGEGLGGGRGSPLEEILLQLTLDGVPASPKKVLFRGERAGEISSYVAGWMAGQGMDVIVVDGANRFDPYMVSSYARRVLISPEEILKRIRIARAFTCYQMATLMGERLSELIEQEGTGLPDLFPSPFGRLPARSPASRSLAEGRRFGEGRGKGEPACRSLGAGRGGGGEKPRGILIGPVTTFLDEDVPEREVRPLFERALSKVEEMAAEGVPFFLFQSSVPSDSRRAYLTKRLSQFSDLVWRIELGDQEPKIILEKGIRINNIIENSKLQNEK